MGSGRGPTHRHGLPLANGTNEFYCTPAQEATPAFSQLYHPTGADAAPLHWAAPHSPRMHLIGQGGEQATGGGVRVCVEEAAVAF